MPIYSKDITYTKKRVLPGHVFESDVVNLFIRNKLVGQIERFKMEPSEYWVRFTPKQQDLNDVDEYQYDSYNEAIKDIISTAMEEGNFGYVNTKLTEDRKPEFFIHSYLTADSDKVYDIRYGFKNSTWTRVGFVRHENWPDTFDNYELPYFAPYFALRKVNLGIEPLETENRRFDSLGEAIKWVLQYSYEWRQGVEFGESLQESNGTFFSRTTPYLFYSDTQGYIISVFYKDSTGTIEIGRVMYGYNRSGTYNAQRTWFGSNVKGELDFDTRKEALDWILEVIPSYKRHTFESKTANESKGVWQKIKDKIKDKISVRPNDITKHIKIKKISGNTYHVYYKGLYAFEIYKYDDDPYDDRYNVVGYVFGEQDWFVDEVIRKSYWNLRHVRVGKEYGIEYGLPDISESKPFDSRNEAIQAVIKAIVDNYKAFDKLVKRSKSEMIVDPVAENSEQVRPNYSATKGYALGKESIYILRNGKTIGVYRRTKGGIECAWWIDLPYYTGTNHGGTIVLPNRQDGIQWIIKNHEEHRKIYKLDKKLDETTENNTTYSTVVDDYRYNMDPEDPIYKRQLRVLRGTTVVGYINYPFMLSKDKTITTTPTISFGQPMPGSYGQYLAWSWASSASSPVSDWQKIYQGPMYFPKLKDAIKWIIEEDTQLLRKKSRKSKKEKTPKVNEATKNKTYSTKVYKEDPLPSGEGYINTIEIYFGKEHIGDINWALTKDKTLDSVNYDPPFEATFYKPIVNKIDDIIAGRSAVQRSTWSIYEEFYDITSASKWIIENHKKLSTSEDKKPTQTNSVMKETEDEESSISIKTKIIASGYDWGPAGATWNQREYEQNTKIFKGKRQLGTVTCILNHDKTLRLDGYGENKTYIAGIKNRDGYFQATTYFQNLRDAIDWIIDNDITKSMTEQKTDNENNDHITLDGPYYWHEYNPNHKFKYYNVMKGVVELGKIGWWQGNKAGEERYICSLINNRTMGIFDSISKAVQDVIDKNTESK